MELKNKHRTCKVFKDGIFITSGKISVVCKELEHPNWQSGISHHLVKGEIEVNYNGYLFVIDDLKQEIKPSCDPRKSKGYNKALSILSDNNLEPLFTFDDWHGQTVADGNSSKSAMYDVRCKLCDSIYQTYFKLARPNPIRKCPYCNSVARDPKLSMLSIKPELDAADIELVDTEWKGRSKSYKVRCKICGLEFTTTLRHNHFNNCPYCYESSNAENQIPKIKKICEDNYLTLLDTEYKPSSSDGKPSYLVRCNHCGTQFRAKFNGKQVTNCPKCCLRKQRSARERLMSILLENKGVPYFPNYRGHSVCLPDSHNPMELDLFLPEKNIAFEFNGQAYHNSSDGQYHKDKDYHKLKTELFLSKGIKVYHIWDFTSDSLCKSILLSKSGLSKRVYARKLTIKEVPASDAKLFFERCHVDGNVKSQKYYGLYLGNTLMCCLSLMIRVLQASKQVHWEIGRFATELGYTVVGGYSRLLKNAIQYLKSIGVTELISYCNRDLSPDYQDTFYYKYGFEFCGDSGPIYWYWASKSIEYNGKLIPHASKVSRQVFQRQKLLDYYKQHGLELPENSTEKELAAGIGLYQIHNSGNWKFRLRL